MAYLYHTTSLCVILKGAAINRPDYEFQIYWSNMFTASAVVTPFYLSLLLARVCHNPKLDLQL